MCENQQQQHPRGSAGVLVVQYFEAVDTRTRTKCLLTLCERCTILRNCTAAGIRESPSVWLAFASRSPVAGRFGAYLCLVCCTSKYERARSTKREMSNVSYVQSPKKYSALFEVTRKHEHNLYTKYYSRNTSNYFEVRRKTR